MMTELSRVLLLCTTRCNLKCGFCKYSCRDGVDLPLEAIRTLAPQMADAGIKTVFISGGEPLLRRDFGEMTASLLDAGLDIRLSTNGTLITSSRVKELRGINDISISIDGPRDIHDRVRGVPGAFDKMHKGLQTALDHLPETSFCASITMLPENVESLEWLVETTLQLGFNSVGIQPPVPSFFSSRERADLYESKSAVKEMATAFHALSEKKEKLFSNDARYYSLSREFIKNGFRSVEPCEAGQKIATLFADGSIGPCWALGTGVGTDKFAFGKAVAQPAFKKAKERASRGDCSGCLFYCYFMR